MSDGSTRESIVEAADRLFYRQGYENTSFADIADAVGLSRGNFYYHFKSKDRILDAVIEERLRLTRTMLAQWEADSRDPEERIASFIRILIVNGNDIERYGCPVGTLSTELAKLNHEAQPGANAIFTLFRDWLRAQFEALGCGDDADALALHVLAMSQGVATLSSAFRDEAFVRREVDNMIGWVRARIARPNE